MKEFSWTYEVTPVDSYGRTAGRAIYVRASNSAVAEIAGKRWLKMLGTRGKFSVRVKLYNPLLDPDMQGYVRAITPGTPALEDSK